MLSLRIRSDLSLQRAFKFYPVPAHEAFESIKGCLDHGEQLSKPYIAFSFKSNKMFFVLFQAI